MHSLAGCTAVVSFLNATWFACWRESFVLEASSVCSDMVSLDWKKLCLSAFDGLVLF